MKKTGIIDFKSPNQPVSAKDIGRSILDSKEYKGFSPKLEEWVLYCNDKKVKNWVQKIRPRSKLSLVHTKQKAGDFEIVFENRSIIVLNKPCGLPTQKTLKSFEDNLYDQVRMHFFKQKLFAVGAPYVGLHHRLDRGTSGLVIMSKQRQINKELADLFKNRQIKKTYEAVTEKGNQEPKQQWTEKNYIKRISPQKKKFYFAVSDQGDEAITKFQWLGALEGLGQHFYCFPKTGRTHQIRVHLSHCGYPILGDAVYGTKNSAPRLMLHARQLEFHLNGEDFNLVQPPDWDLSFATKVEPKIES